MRLGLVAAVLALLAAVLSGGPADAQDNPAPESVWAGDFPFGQDAEAEVEGTLSVWAQATGFGPGGMVRFPIGGEGACNPSGKPAIIRGSVSQDQGDGYASFLGVEIVGQPADVVVTDDGAICASVSLMSEAQPYTGVESGEIDLAEDGTGWFRLDRAAGRMELTGTGAFAAHIPEGCYLPLTWLPDLEGSIEGGELPPPPPDDPLAGAPAPRVTVGEAPEGCGAFGLLLDVGFDLPTTAAGIALDTTYWHPAHPDDGH